MADFCILEQGVWKGHPAGAFEVTEKHLDSAIEYFKREGNMIPFDMQHYEQEAYGWITDLYKKEYNGKMALWASVDWNPDGKDLIESGKFKYMSPSLWFNVPDQREGEDKVWLMQVFSVALTNYPFMTNLPELQLQKFRENAVSRNVSTVMLCSTEIGTNRFIQNSINIIKGANMADPNEVMAKIAEAVGMGADASPDEVVGYVKKLAELLSMMPEGAGGAPTPEEAGEMLPEMAQNHKLVTELTESLKCDAKDLKAKVTELSKRPEAKVDNKKDDEITGLRAKVDEMKQEIELSKREAAAVTFIAENSAKIPPEMRDKVKAQYIKDPEFVQDFYENAKPVIDTKERKVVNSKDIELTENQKRTADRFNIPYDKYKEQLAKDKTTLQEFQNMKNGGS